jgi:hypothetical protein
MKALELECASLLNKIFDFAQRLSSAMNCVGAERAARSTIRDNAVHSL